MLKIKINKTESKGETYTPIHISGITYNDGKIFITSSSPHFFKNNEEAYLIRSDGNVYFREAVNIIRKNDKEFSFEYKDWVNYHSYGMVELSGGTIFLFHSIIPLASNRSNVHIPYSCKDGGTHYEINDIYLNILSGETSVNDNLFVEDGIEIDGIKYDAIIPVIKNGYDDEHAIFVPDFEFSPLISPQFLSIKIRNEKFFHFEDESVSINDRRWNLNSGIFNKSGELEIKLPFSDTFRINLNQEDAFGANYIDNEIDNAINPIIDYEKRVFVPVYMDGEREKDVESITYNLHFRQRVDKSLESDRYPDYGEWKTEDKYYWNNYSSVTTEKILVPSVSGLTSDMADIIGYLGFTDEDVYYQRNALKKSFLRISVYDTPYRETQNLLFYSTMFVNTGELHGKLLHNISNGYNTEEIPFTMNNGIDNGEIRDGFERMSVSFKIAGKYNYKLPSEGFYIHLFPSILDTAETCEIEGYEGFKKLYLKIEFNHAKYGYTVPMSLPHNDNGIIEPTDSGFPVDYVAKNSGSTDYSGDTYYIDMNRVFRDIYVEILIRYDESTNRYIWMFSPILHANANMVINLFEPRINGEK